MGMVTMFKKMKQFTRSFRESFKTISTLNNRFSYINQLQFNSAQDCYPEEVQLLVDCISTRYIKKLVDSNIELFISPAHVSDVFTNSLDALRGLGSLTVKDDQPLLIINSTKLRDEIAGLSQYQSIVVFESFLEHELEHLRQINRGDLKIYRENFETIVEWKGNKYLFNYINSLPPAMYDDLPWEHEAVTAEIEYIVRLGYYADVEEGWRKRLSMYDRLDTREIQKSV